MKIVNINNYDENDGLRSKLRQRMDAHEPELSDSVWDRIHHEMDVKDGNRKKRFLWWFSSVAVVVLAAGIGIFSLWNTDETTVVAQNIDKEIIINTPPQISKFSLEEANGDKPSNSNLNSTESNTVNQYLGSQANGTNGRLVPPPPSPTPIQLLPSAPITESFGNGSNEKLETKEGDTKEILETPAPTTTPENGENNPVATTDNSAETEEKLTDSDADDNSGNSGETIPAAKQQKNQRWFVAAQYSLNRTFRTVSDNNPLFLYPDAETRNKYENAAFVSNYGIEVGFYPVKNFFIKSGFGIFNYAETVKYNIEKRKYIPIIQPFPDNYHDSITPGSNNSVVNNYSYIQVPIEVGYSRQLSKKWGVFGSTGVALNFLQGYTYNFYEPVYESEIISSKKLGFNDMYKNFIMISGTIGGQYHITNNWAATLGINYRRALTSASTEKYGVDVRPYSIGATTGIAYNF